MSDKYMMDNVEKWNKARADANSVKMLIELSTSVPEADSIIKTYTFFNTDEERIAYLEDIFDVHVVHRTDDNVHTDYIAMLTSIVEHR